MTAAAYSTVDALCFALQEPGVASRLIITCRYFSETAWPAHKLFVESLTRLRQADAVRKVEFLLTGANAGDRNAEREKRILGAAYGNPRLLEWLLKIPRDVAGAEMLTQLEQVAESFRENTLARVLVRALDEAERKALARLSLFRLPVPMTAVEAMADGARVERSVGLGLIEKGEVQGEELLAVPVILDPILQAALTDQEWAEARKRAARFALKVWWDEPERPRYDRMTEVMRLGMEAGEREIAVKAGDWVAISWINTGRHVEALAISKPLLERFDDYRTASTMASAEEVLGQVEAALGHYEHAIATCPPTDRARLAATLKNLASVRARLGDVEKAFSQWKESLDIWDSLSDAPGKASTLRDMALVVAQTGDLDGSMNLLKQALILQSSADEGGRARILHEIARLKAERKEVAEALEIWEEALVIMNRHGDLQGVAAALHEMGRAIAQRGEWVDAERCWERSLEISNNIKDLRTQAATLHEMAIMALTQDKSDQAMELWQKSLDIETRIRNLPGMAATLNHMAMVAANRGTDDAGAEALYRQSVEVSAASRAYRDLATALSGLGMITREGKAAYLAQAVWLMIHTEAAPEKVVLVLTRLFEWAPSGDPIEALLAAMVQHLVAQRGQNHPMATELYEQGGSMLGAAAINAGHKDAVSVWVSELRLADMPSVQLRLDACLESLVGDNWLFDRSLLTETG
jgi:tetratricopeptide (TPR) repeat protein